MKTVCKNCFGDKELAGFISSGNIIANCECCGSENVEIILFDELLDFFKELFDNFKNDDGGNTLISVIQSHWGLFIDHNVGNKVLNHAINLLNTNLKSSEDYVNFNDEIVENINHWHKLKDQLKWQKRYLTDINFLTYDLGWDSFFESKTIISHDKVFYRARLHHKADDDVYSSDKMFCPPKDFSSGGRANPSGIPFLYLSDNEKTILYEIRSSYLDEVSVASFTLAENVVENIIISDFTEVPNLFAPTEVNKRIKATLLKKLISRDLSTPMRRYDSDLDYIPTQFICEFIKVFTGVQGIMFRSSLHNIGNNLVIFDQNIFKCLSVKKVRITKVSIDYIDI